MSFLLMGRAGERDEFVRDAVERHLPLHCTQFKGNLGHPVDDAGCCILADRACAGFAHGEQAFGAVPAHAGEDHADAARACNLGDRVEQHVDRRAVSGHGVARAQAAARTRAARDDLEMVRAAGCEIDAAHFEHVAVGGFRHRRLAQAIEAFRKALREGLRHVLRDHDRRAVLRHVAHDGDQRFDTAGRGADGDHGARIGAIGALLGGRRGRARRGSGLRNALLQG